MSSEQSPMPPDVGLWLLPHPSPPLYRTVLLGALTSLWLSGGIATGAARELVTASSRLARRERAPRG